MAKVDRTTLKSYFEEGDKPIQQQFDNFIDSVLNLIEESEVEATIIVNVPVLGTGAGGKILKKGDAVIQMNEYSDNETVISSDNGALSSGGASYFGSSAIMLNFNGINVVYGDGTSTVLKHTDQNVIRLEEVLSKLRIFIDSKDELILGSSSAKLSFFEITPTHGKQSITGSRGGNAALTSLLTALGNLNLIDDNTTI